MWEILTREEPFREYETLEDFRNAVCYLHARPRIPDNCHPSIKRLIECCWQPNPEKRPSFPEIVVALDHIIVDCAISDEIGKRMWKERFLNQVIFFIIFSIILFEDFQFSMGDGTQREMILKICNFFYLFSGHWECLISHDPHCQP